MSETVVDRPSRSRKSRTRTSRSCSCTAIERHYRQGDDALHILNGAELAVWPGQSVALVAPSGAGKSTLLHIAGLLEHPDDGDVYIDGRATATCPMPSAPASAATRSASSTSRTICCRNSPRWRTCCCRR